MASPERGMIHVRPFGFDMVVHRGHRQGLMSCMNEAPSSAAVLVQDNLQRNPFQAASMERSLVRLHPAEIVLRQHIRTIGKCGLECHPAMVIVKQAIYRGEAISLLGD